MSRATTAGKIALAVAAIALVYRAVARRRRVARLRASLNEIMRASGHAAKLPGAVGEWAHSMGTTARRALDCLADNSWSSYRAINESLEKNAPLFCEGAAAALSGVETLPDSAKSAVAGVARALQALRV
jgi:hypothetical protein